MEVGGGGGAGAKEPDSESEVSSALEEENSSDDFRPSQRERLGTTTRKKRKRSERGKNVANENHGTTSPSNGRTKKRRRAAVQTKPQVLLPLNKPQNVNRIWTNYRPKKPLKGSLESFWGGNLSTTSSTSKKNTNSAIEIVIPDTSEDSDSKQDAIGKGRSRRVVEQLLAKGLNGGEEKKEKKETDATENETTNLGSLEGSASNPPPLRIAKRQRGRKAMSDKETQKTEEPKTEEIDPNQSTNEKQQGNFPITFSKTLTGEWMVKLPKRSKEQRRAAAQNAKSRTARQKDTSNTTGATTEFFLSNAQKKERRQLETQKELQLAVQRTRELTSEWSSGRQLHPFLLAAAHKSGSMSKEQEINLEKETDKVSPLDVSIITRADVMADIQSEYFHADRGWVLVADKDISCIAYSPASQGVYCDVREALQAIEPYKLGSTKPRKKEPTKQEHDGEYEETKKQMDSLIAGCVQLFVQDPQSNNVEEDREWEDQDSAQEICRSILKKSGYYDDLEQSQTSSLQTLLWVDKYKPQDSRQVLCDIAWKDLPMDPASFISEWLHGWNENIQDNRTKKQKAAKMKKGRKTTFRNTKLPHCNALLLKGRTGASCKTAMVYACAQEHHYRILEVNSAMRRDGRKIIQLFSEATQSHHLSCAKTVSSQEPQEISPSLEHSLVLFEEVDVVFDQDKGFFSAVAALIRESKRPIVLTCNELTPEVHQALESNGINILLLECEGPLERDLLLYLQLVCAAERMPMHAITSTSDDLRLLIQHMKLDVRQLLMTLQLWCCESSATLKKDTRASQQSLEGKKPGLDFGRMIGFRKLTILQVLFGIGMEQQRIDPQEREIFLRHAFDHNFQLDLLWHNYLSIFECPSLDNSRFTFKPPKEILEREGTIDYQEGDASSTASIKEKAVDLQSISNQDSTMDVLALVADSLSYCDLIDSYFDSAVEIDHVLHDGVPEITIAHHLCAQLQITSGGQVGTLLSETQTPSVLADLRCKQPFGSISEPACSKHNTHDQVNFVHRRIKEHLVPLYHQRGSQEEMLEYVSWVEHMVFLDKAAPLTTKRRRSRKGKRHFTAPQLQFLYLNELCWSEACLYK